MRFNRVVGEGEESRRIVEMNSGMVLSVEKVRFRLSFRMMGGSGGKARQV